MDTTQYLNMFLEESLDNLQVLNESLLDLENNPKDKEKLNEIFRVAHTLKGMSATMGFANVANLTHKMEDVLSKFREGDLDVTPKVITVLFKCLDTLEQMVDNIGNDKTSELDINYLLVELHNIVDEGVEDTQDIEIHTGNIEKSIYSDSEITIINTAKQQGYRTYKVGVVINKETILKSARAFLVVKTLEEFGEIIKSVPSTEDIEAENFDTYLEFICITLRDNELIQEALKGVSEVEDVVVEDVALETEVNSKLNIELADGKIIDDSIESEEVTEGNKEVSKEKDKSKGNKSKGNKSKGNKSKGGSKKPQSVRVELSRLDNFMNLVSELVMHRTRLEQISINNKMTDFNEILEQVGRITSELQELVMKIRMLPLETVLSRFPRLIRDLSISLDKEMELEIEGGSTELDRTVIDEIGEPLVHLLRNSVDHGIESAEVRRVAGKNPVGKIKLSAYQEGTRAIIKVEDDGRGIDVEKVRAKAEKEGLRTEGLSEDDIKNLIFEQGFSTAEVITDVSGRGVGMDVVKSKITSIGGTIELQSEQGKGTTFTISLPLSLQIMQALLVNVGSEIMAISMGYIDKVIDFDADMIKKTGGKEIIIYNEKVIPLIRVADYLNLTSGETKKYNIIIVQVTGKTVALLVDELVGQQEIVIKPLGKVLKDMKEYTGNTILGNGLVTLILDVAELVKRG